MTDQTLALVRLCPNCRSEYLYAYRWGRLLKTS